MAISNNLSVYYHTVVRYNINKSEVFIWTLPKESNSFQNKEGGLLIVCQKTAVYLYRLSKNCGLSENTIATILKRNSLPSVGTLEAICKGFGITLSEFFAEGDLIEVSSDTKQLIEYWGGISPKQKQIILDLLKNMNQE